MPAVSVTYSYRRLDVFTTQAFGGNPLAVFLDAGHLSSQRMQAIAREMNLSETVFISPMPASPQHWAVRFFTPTIELPFAGHPTVGTAVALFLDGMLGQDLHVVDVTLHEGVGPVPVTVTQGDRACAHAVFSTPKLPSFGPADVASDMLAAMLGLDATEVLTDAWAPRTVSCGVPFYVVAVRSLAAIKRIRLRHDLWEAHLASHWAPNLYVVTPEVEQPGSAVHVRMFAPAMGIDEDPATGGAATAFAGFLVAAEGVQEGPQSWRIEQGFEMGRPSLLDLEADISAGVITAVRLGGSAVLIGRGTLDLPD